MFEGVQPFRLYYDLQIVYNFITDATSVHIIHSILKRFINSFTSFIKFTQIQKRKEKKLYTFP
jgi:hypothetical protein